jgi:hypothetical protein
MDTHVKLSIASELNKMLNSAKLNLEINDYHYKHSNWESYDKHLDKWTRCEILDGIKFYESKLSELDPINQSPAGADWDYYCSVNY